MNPQEHANTIAATVQDRGICIFWSEVLGEKVAFVRDIRFLRHVPKGIPIYTSAELRELFGEGKTPISPGSLKLIHAAKKEGGEVTSHERRE